MATDSTATRFGSSQPRPLGSFIIQGNVYRKSSRPRLLASCPSLPRSRAARGAPKGDSLYGPRIGGNNITTHVTEGTDRILRLYRKNLVIAQTGDPSPSGSVIRGICSAVVNKTGLTFYQLTTEDGLELCVHNGEQAALILSRGDVVDGHTIDTIAFGMHTTQSDSAGRIVTYVQATSGQEFILLGVPV